MVSRVISVHIRVNDAVSVATRRVAVALDDGVRFEQVQIDDVIPSLLRSFVPSWAEDSGAKLFGHAWSLGGQAGRIR